MYVDVLVDQPVRQALTYRAIPAILPYLTIGSLIEVPFARSRTLGIVTALRRRKPNGTDTIRPVSKLVSAHWAYPTTLRAAADLASRTQEPPGICLFRLLPPAGKRPLTFPPAAALTHRQGQRYHLYAPQAVRFAQYALMANKAVDAGEQVLIIMPTESRQELLNLLPKGSTEAVDGSYSPTKQRAHAAAFAQGALSILVGTRHCIGWNARLLRWLIIDDPTDFAHHDDQRPYADAATLGSIRHCAEGSHLVLGTALPTPGMVLAEQQRAAKRIRVTPSLGTVTLRQHNPLHIIDDLRATHASILLVAPRQGLGGTIECQQCHWSLHCTECGGELQIQANTNSFTCYGCSSPAKRPTSCANCNSRLLSEYGIGVEAVRANLMATIGTIPPSIRIGTEFDLAQSSIYDLIVFLYADSPLLSPRLDRPIDYLRSIAEARGRAASVLIHTRHPEQATWALLGTHAIAAYNALLARRRTAQLPPFWRIITIPKPISAKQFAVLQETAGQQARFTEDRAMIAVSLPSHQYDAVKQAVKQQMPTLRLQSDSILAHA